jgi:hypothetical protein
MSGPIEEAQERGFTVVTNYRLVYIVCSLCGGTGSGMFLDVAHTVRHYVGSSPSVMGILMLPSVFEADIRSDLQRRRVRANTYAALKELNHFHTHQSFRAHYPGEQVPLPTTRHRAFNQIFLIDRTNASGRALSGKAAAAQMAAHMVHLTAFSHLNTRILGLDVNITEERTATVEGSARSFLSYSSFGVSALVMPREALWRYCVAMSIGWAMAHLIPDQQPHSADDPRFWAAYLALRDDIKQEFQRHADDEHSLRRLRSDMVHRDGAWLSFVRLVGQAIERLFRDYGQAGALYVIHRLTQDEAAALRDDLAHPAQQPFGEPRQARPVRWWERPFRSAEEIRLSVEAALDQRRYQARRDAWSELLGALRTLARGWQEGLERLAQEAAQSQHDALEEAERAAQQIHPLRANGDRDTSTYYDLETGAVGQGHLEDYLDSVLRLLDTPRSEDDSRTRWDILLHALYERLLTGQPGGALLDERASTRYGLRQSVEDTLRQHPELATLRDDVRQAFDLRTIVYVQHHNGQGAPPPNDRIDQVLQRLAPYARVDGDTYHYSEADQERIQLIGTPAAASETASPAARALRQRLQSYGQYEWVPTGSTDRLDACSIVHGLPLGQLTSTAEMYWEYHGNAFARRVLHLQPEWEHLDEIYAPPEPFEEPGAGPTPAGEA